MAGEKLPAPDPIDPALIDLAARGGVHVSLPSRPTAAHTFVVTVIAPDTPGLLSHAAGVLALHSLRVLSASLGSHGDSAVNSFVVSPRFGAPPQAGLLRQELIRAMAGELDVLERLDAQGTGVARDAAARGSDRGGRSGAVRAGTAAGDLVRTDGADERVR